MYIDTDAFIHVHHCLTKLHVHSQTQQRTFALMVMELVLLLKIM
jgi:hypothetical protein